MLVGLINISGQALMITIKGRVLRDGPLEGIHYRFISNHLGGSGSSL